MKLLYKIKLLKYFLLLIFSLTFLNGEKKIFANNEEQIFNKMLTFLLNSQNVAMDFIQTDSNENKSYTGTMLISNGKNFRVNYYYPASFLIVGNEYNVSIYDYDMDSVLRLRGEEYSNIFFLRDYKEFTKNFTIKKHRLKKSLEIFEIFNKKLQTSVKLAFDIKSKELKTLEIKEYENEIFTNFTKVQKINFADKELFFIKNPDRFGPPKRLNKKDLKNFYR
ncbi:MAG: outer-membrane lipoprotein carrier protein LolA [Rickettsia sp.]|nr:outer-membrane lipoprotein carrier protein LolA [Rickettsia sp.]